MNMARTELLGCGEQIAYLELTEELLTEKMNQVLNDKSYETNVAKISKRFKDQPQPPLERAIYWIEYVLRNDDIEFMRTSAQYLRGYEYYNFDAYALIFISIFAAIMIPFFIIKKLFNFIKRVFRCSKSKSKKKIN